MIHWKNISPTGGKSDRVFKPSPKDCYKISGSWDVQTIWNLQKKCMMTTKNHVLFEKITLYMYEWKRSIYLISVSVKVISWSWLSIMNFMLTIIWSTNRSFISLKKCTSVNSTFYCQLPYQNLPCLFNNDPNTTWIVSRVKDNVSS